MSHDEEKLVRPGEVAEANLPAGSEVSEIYLPVSLKLWMEHSLLLDALLLFCLFLFEPVLFSMGGLHLKSCILGGHAATQGNGPMGIAFVLYDQHLLSVQAYGYHISFRGDREVLIFRRRPTNCRLLENGALGEIDLLYLKPLLGEEHPVVPQARLVPYQRPGE
ncbi:hypothetical protein DSECCO2_515100 [anaerobic digester metagenome]